MKQCDVLVQLWFATDKKGLDFWYNKFRKRVALQVSTNLKTWKYQENIKAG